jgi:hypothetical protein
MQALIYLGIFWGGIFAGFVLCAIIVAGKEADANRERMQSAAAAWRDE